MPRAGEGFRSGPDRGYWNSSFTHYSDVEMKGPPEVPEFKNGQRVHVEFDGVIDRHWTDINGHTVGVRRDHGFVHSVRPEDITRVTEPTDWEKYGPPQVGDIWEADGVEYAVLFSGSVSPDIFPMDSVGNILPDTLKALNPTLKRRRDVAGNL